MMLTLFVVTSTPSTTDSCAFQTLDTKAVKFRAVLFICRYGTIAAQVTKSTRAPERFLVTFLPYPERIATFGYGLTSEGFSFGK